MGEALGDRVGHLTGVDLSPAMIARARERGVYDALVADDAVAVLRRQPPATFDLIVAADSLVYIGDLAPLFAAAATALTGDGLIAFSVETSEHDGFSLGASMRFAHSRACVEATASAAGLRSLFLRAASIRREAGVDAPGLICVFERTEQQGRA
jgi:predicted TPR repeat methyltransferase